MTVLTVDRPRARFRFTLRGLMVSIVGVAMGALEAQLEHPRFSDAMLTCLSVWAAFGLAHQISDLWRASSKWNLLTTDERWGTRFAIAWRVAVILLLLAYYGVRTLLAGKEFSLPEEDAAVFSFPPAAALREALLCLLLMLILWSVPRLRSPPRRRSIVWWGLQGVAATCGAALCLLLWWRLSVIHFLVQVACVGVESYQPTRFAIPNFNTAVRYPAFVLESLFDATLVGLSFALIWFLSQSWQHSRRRLFLLLCLGAELATLSWYTVWLTTVGARRVSPWMVEVWQIGSVHRWITAALVVAVVAAALAMRLARTPTSAAHGPALAWRSDAGRYYHERRSWSACCMLAGAAGVAQEAIELARITAGTELFEEVLGHPMVAMYSATCLLAMRATFARAPRDAVDFTPVSMPRFCVFFVANLITLSCAGPAMTALSTSLWLTRWYDLPV